MLDPRPAQKPRDPAAATTADAVCRTWYEAYGGQLYNYLRFHLASPDLAEDLTAEVFLRALKGFAQFDRAIGSPRAWLFRIAHNALRDHQRQARRRPVVALAAMRDLEYQAPSAEERRPAGRCADSIPRKS